MKKAKVFFSKGLGDYLLFFMLAENLFPHFLIKAYPKDHKQIDEILSESDLIIVNGAERWFNILIQQRIKVLNLNNAYILFFSTCKQKSFLGDYKFSSQIGVLENLQNFCLAKLHLENISLENGFRAPSFLESKTSSKVIVLHAISFDFKRNWPKNKFLALYKILKKNGYNPVFCFRDTEKAYFSEEELISYTTYFFSSLHHLVNFLQKAIYFIGNDSGLGHLYSLLKIPILTISASSRKRIFWKPFWQIGHVITLYALILNCKGLRLREKYWHHFIEAWRVYWQFCKLKKDYERKV